jgi:WD40 repeat protein
VDVWEVAAGTLKHTIWTPADGVNALAISPNSAWLVTSGEQATIAVWDLKAVLQ